MEETVKQENFILSGIPAILYGSPSESVYLFLHGKMGRKEEGEAFAQVVCPKGWQVLSIDLPEHGDRAGEAGFDPWHVVPELRGVLAYAQARWPRVGLRATSLGAWFAMVAFLTEPLDRALFLSPVTDMVGLIEKMMDWAGVSEEALAQAGELPTDFGETLSWRYLQYARAHPVDDWNTPTAILYGETDHLTAPAAMGAFAAHPNRHLTIMPGGAHWFHTPEQLDFLRQWEAKNT